MLARDDYPSAAATTTAWMLVDGASVGLGTLLKPCLPTPRLVFTETRAVVVEWDAVEAGSWMAEPLRLLRRGGEGDGGRRPLSDWGQDINWGALQLGQAEGGGYRLRVGGLTPDTLLALCLAVRSANADGHECCSCWLELRTRAARNGVAAVLRVDAASAHWRGEGRCT